MNVGLDIDGTITSMPWLFKILSQGLKKEGHRVVIITFRGEFIKEQTEEMLREMGVVYDKIYYGQNIVDPEWKGKIAAEENLNVIFEDDISVLSKMPATTVLCQVFGNWPYHN